MSNILVNLHCHIPTSKLINHNSGLDNHIFILNPLIEDDVDSQLSVVMSQLSNINYKLSTGQHPLYPHDSITLKYTIDLLQNNKLFAVGEIGFDKRNPDFNWQKSIFLQFADLAQQYQKPIIIHCVGYHYELYKILKKNFPLLTIILHSFHSSLEIVKLYSDLHTIFSIHKSVLKVYNSHRIIKEIVTYHEYAFETDDDDNIDVSDTIKTIANFTQTEENMLITKQHQTYNSLLNSDKACHI